jgi:N-acetylneuraminic acid mutarotase
MKTLIAFSLAILLAMMPSVCIAEEWWSEGSPITTGLVGMSAEALDGTIYLFGGMFPPVPYYVTTVEAYEPEADLWSLMTPMPEDRMNVSLTAVGDSIYVFGGIGGGYVKSTVWKYTPSLEGTPEGPWQTKNPIGYPVSSGTEICAGKGVAVSGGKVYIFGGFFATNVVPYVYANWHPYSTIWCYDPANDMWERKTDLPFKGFFHATPHGDKIYLIGDSVEGENPPGIFWEYDPSTDTLNTTGLPPFAGGETARTASVGTIGDAIYVAGGYKDWAYTILRSSTWKYSFALPELGWVRLADMLHPVLGAATATSRGNLYLFGGYANTASQSIDFTQVLHVTIPVPTIDAVTYIRAAIAEKVEALERINSALEKEWAVYEAMEELLESGEYSDLKKGDIVGAKQKIHSAIQRQEQSKKALEKSIENLEDSLVFIGGLVLPSPYSWFEYNGHHYALTLEHGTWEQAEAEAVAVGGHLVTINDADENAWITEFIKDVYVLGCPQPISCPGSNVAWIGYYKNNVEWSWVNEEPVTYTNFLSWYGGVYAYIHGSNHPTSPGAWNNNPTHYTNEVDHTLGVIEVPW